jgi:DNA-binding LacI/PurR family transcriptional regulator
MAIKRKRPTIKDVAAHAKVSRQTVSRVINQKDEILPATRERVLHTMRELNYRPNAIARSMATGRSYTLGCISPNLTDYTFACFVEGAKTEARRCNFFLHCVSAASENEIPALCEELVDSGRVEGLLVINPYADGRRRYFKDLIAQGIPVVYLGTRPREEPISSVYLDDEDGAYQATRHLIRLGHREIAMITGPSSEYCVSDRVAGYTRALTEAGLNPQTERILEGDWSATSGYQAMQTLLNSGAQFTALFAQNDRMAVGAIRAARERGLKVPNALAVVGFDDMPLASYFDPALTTVSTDFFEHGRRGARILIETIGNPSRPPELVVFPAHLVVRESCGAKLAIPLDTPHNHSEIRATT